MQAIWIDEKDNVVTMVVEAKAGQQVFYRTKKEDINSCFVREDIPVFHKLAIENIPQNSPIIKYGQHIGFAKEDIIAGQYVHIHNVYSKRENLRSEE